MQVTHFPEDTSIRNTTDARPGLHASKLRIRCRWLRRGAISRPDNKHEK
jgi:hypothetical protein